MKKVEELIIELSKMKPIKFSKRHEKRMEKLFEDLRNEKIKPAGD